MAKAQHTAHTRILVGIDISKNRHEVLIAVPDKTRRRRMTVLNTADDYQRLIALLRGFEMPVTIGFEATGNYHRALMHALGAAGFDLKLVSSVALAQTREALHNSWGSRRGPWPQCGRVSPGDDPKDAQVISHMLQIGAVQVFHGPPRCRHQRQPGAIEDLRDGSTRQDRTVASHPDALPAPLLSRGRSLSSQFSR